MGCKLADFDSSVQRRAADMHSQTPARRARLVRWVGLSAGLWMASRGHALRRVSLSGFQDGDAYIRAAFSRICRTGLMRVGQRTDGLFTMTTNRKSGSDG